MKKSIAFKTFLGMYLIPICLAGNILNDNFEETKPVVSENLSSSHKQDLAFGYWRDDVSDLASTDSDSTYSSPLNTPTKQKSSNFIFNPLVLDQNVDTTDLLETLSISSTASTVSSTTQENAPEIRVLSLDGGGVRGIIEARVLMHIEKEVGKPISQIFDLIGGTSAGGMIATLLSMPNKDAPLTPQYSAEDILNLLLTKSDRLFTKNIFSFWGVFGTKYTPSGLESLLHEFYKNFHLHDSLVDTAVFAYDVNNNQLSTLSSWSNENILTRDAVGATTAAPVYFPAYTIKPSNHEQYGQHRSYIDGGVGANNPAVMLWMEAIKRFDRKSKFDIISLGTGDFQKRIRPQKVKNGGLFTWLKFFPRLISSNQQSTTNNILNFFMEDYQNRLQPSTNIKGEGYYTRFNPTMVGESSALDNYSPEHLSNLLRLTDIYMFNHKEELSNMITRLKGERYTDWLKRQDI